MKTLEDLKKEADELSFAGYTIDTLQENAKEWIKHFMDRFNIKEEWLPKKVHLAPYNREKKPTTYTYGNKDGKKIITWTMVMLPKEQIDSMLPGLGNIAWIKYFFGIKDGEKL